MHCFLIHIFCCVTTLLYTPTLCIDPHQPVRPFMIALSASSWWESAFPRRFSLVWKTAPTINTAPFYIVVNPAPYSAFWSKNTMFLTALKFLFSFLPYNWRSAVLVAQNDCYPCHLLSNFCSSCFIHGLTCRLLLDRPVWWHFLARPAGRRDHIFRVISYTSIVRRILLLTTTVLLTLSLTKCSCHTAFG